MFRRRRQWRHQRIFWDAFAAGLAMWCIGSEVGFTRLTTLTEERSRVQWHTMFSLCGGIGPVVALIARPYLGARKSSASAASDLISYAMLMGFVFAYFIMVPSVVPASGPAPQSTLLWLVQLQRFVLAAGLVWVCVAGAQTAWRNTFARLAIGATVGFFLRLITSGADQQRPLSGRELLRSRLDRALGCYTWAALEAPSSSSDPESIPARGGWQAVVLSAAPVFLIPLIGFASCASSRSAIRGIRCGCC